jgi:hypothetical protein
MKKTMLSLIVVVLVTASAWATEGYNDLAKLVKSKTSEDVIIAFIATSTVSYALSADEIINLKDLGASSGVITAAIRHRTVVTESPEQPAAIAPAATDNSVVYTNEVVQPEPYYYSSWSYPTYIDFGWGWGGGGRYYHREGSGHYHGGYSSGRVSGGGSPRSWSGSTSRAVTRSATNGKRGR